MTSKNALLKVVILGDGAVGKSCLLKRYVTSEFDGVSTHTIGVEFLNKEIDVGDQTFILQIWDTAGQEKFKCLRTPFYRGSDLCLLVFGLDDRDSLDNLSRWKQEFIFYADIKNPSVFPFVVLGNKVDLGENRVVQPEEGLAWCRNNGNLPYIETSAKDATNVEEAFIMAVKAWEEAEEKEQKLYDSETVNLSNHKVQPSRKGFCC